MMLRLLLPLEGRKLSVVQLERRAAMAGRAGLDVSLKRTTDCVEESGRMFRRGAADTYPEVIAEIVLAPPPLHRISARLRQPPQRVPVVIRTKEA